MSTVSATGPDGLRPSHLKQTIGLEAAGWRDGLLSLLLSISSVCLRGDVQAE